MRRKRWSVEQWEAFRDEMEASIEEFVKIVSSLGWSEGKIDDWVCAMRYEAVREERRHRR